MKHPTPPTNLTRTIHLWTWLVALMIFYASPSYANSYTILVPEIKWTFMIWAVFWTMGLINVLFLLIRSTFKSKLFLKQHVNRWININILLAFISAFIWLLIRDVYQTAGIAFLWWFLYVSPAILLLITLTPAVLYYFFYQKTHKS